MSKAQNSAMFVVIGLLLPPLAAAAAGSRDSHSPALTVASAAEPTPRPAKSSSIAVPTGNQLAFSYDAKGVQIYVCQAADTGAAWVFRGPEALLHDKQGRIVIKHGAGPSWQSLADKSKVVGKKLAESARPGTIPELLLEVSSREGAGLLADVTYIQRLATKGGAAPSDGCDGAHLGATARVDYSATYAFYRPKPDHKPPSN
jgi:Protein of unknown function (DUF3455)